MRYQEEFDMKLLAELEDAAHGPTAAECLLKAGHVGMSWTVDGPIFGFTPKVVDLPNGQVFKRLRDLKAFPGQVSDDTMIFHSAKERGLEVIVEEIRVPLSTFVEIRRVFDEEQTASKYRYSFPTGEGDCNCATWLKCIGVPIVESSGTMRLYVESAKRAGIVRKVGDCKDE